MQHPGTGRQRGRCRRRHDSRGGHHRDGPLRTRRRDAAADQDEGKPVVVISGVGTAPALATRRILQRAQARALGRARRTCRPFPRNGILAATVPGVFDGLMLALEKYGTMCFCTGGSRRLSNITSGFPATEIFVELHRRDEQYLAALARLARSSSCPADMCRKPVRLFRRARRRTLFDELIAAEKKTHGKREEKTRSRSRLFLSRHRSQRSRRFFAK